MKRDMELIRRILLAVENDELSSTNYHERVLPGVPEDVYFSHVRLLDEAGLLKAIGMKGDNYALYYPDRLTWEGHEFLDSIRNETVWAKVKHRLGEQLSSVPIPVIAQLGVDVLKHTLGI